MEALVTLPTTVVDATVDSTARADMTVSLAGFRPGHCETRAGHHGHGDRMAEPRVSRDRADATLAPIAERGRRAAKQRQVLAITGRASVIR